MNTTPDPATRDFSRRRVLELLGIGAAGVVGAGALSSCAKGGTDTDGGGGGGPAEFHGAYPYELPPTGHFNLMEGVLKGILYETPYQDLLTLRGAFYLWSESKYESVLAEKWGFDKKERTFTYTIRKGLEWSDGKPVTSQDVLSTFLCRRVMRQPEWEYCNGIEVKDEQTVVFSMDKPSTVVERMILEVQVLSAATYGDISEKAEKLFAAGKSLDSNEGSALNQELQKLRPKELIVNGPFRIDVDSITSAQLALTKNKTGYNADKVKFDKIVVFKGETKDVAPLVASKKVDYATHGFAVAQEKSFVQNGIEIARPPTYSGPALYFNLGKLKELGDPLARQAFAHAIDRDENGKFSLGDSGVGAKYMVGFSDLLVPEWVSSDIQGKLDKYEYDQDKAAKLLERAGWKRRGKKWMTPDGKPASYDIGYPSDYADWAPCGKNIAEQLTNFGIDVEKRGVVHQQLDEDVYKGRFTLAVHPWGVGNPHPYFGIQNSIYTYNYPVAKNQGGRGIDFDLTQDTKAYGRVDMLELMLATGVGLDEDAQKEKVSKLAHVFNELLPVVPIFERYGNNACVPDVRVKDWPDPDDPILKNSPYEDNHVMILMLRGELKPA